MRIKTGDCEAKLGAWTVSVEGSGRAVERESSQYACQEKVKMIQDFLWPIWSSEDGSHHDEVRAPSLKRLVLSRKRFFSQQQDTNQRTMHVLWVGV